MKSRSPLLILPLILLVMVLVTVASALIGTSPSAVQIGHLTDSDSVTKNNSEVVEKKDARSPTLNSLSRPDDFYLRFPVPNRTAGSIVINSIMDHNNANLIDFYRPDSKIVAYTGEIGEYSNGTHFIANFNHGDLYEARNLYHTSFILNGSSFVLNPSNGSSSTYLAYDGHQGVDFRSTDQGTLRMHAAYGGAITCLFGDGVNTVVIDHGNGYRTRYLHMTNRICQNGPVPPVMTGDEIGTIWNIGAGTGTSNIHAHFEVQVLVGGQWQTVDPYGWQGQYSDPRGNGTSTYLWKPIASTAGTSTRWHPNGALVTDVTDNNHTVYLIQNYEKWGVPSESVFYDYGFDFANVIKISHEEFIRTPFGGILDSHPSPRLRNDGGTVYEIIARGNQFYKRGFTTRASFEGQGFRWSDVVTASVAGIPDDPIMPVYSAPFRDGTLVAELDISVLPSVRRIKPNTPVYIISNSRRRAFVSAPAFTNLGYRFDDVLLLQHDVLASIGTGPDICESTTTSGIACGGITNDVYPPSVLIYRSIFGSNFGESRASTSTTDTVFLTGVGTDADSGNNGVDSVTVNGVRASNDTATGGGSANWTKTLQLNPGLNTIVVEVTDNSPNHNRSQQVITIDYQPVNNDTIPPLLAVTSPVDGSTIDTQQVTVVGTATDAGAGNNGISSVTVNGVPATNAVVQGSDVAYWSATIGLTLGSNTVTAVARDNSSNQNQSLVTFTVNVTNPGQTTIPLDYAWTNKQPMPAGVESPAVAVLNGKIHVFGGRPLENINSHYRYDPVLNQWEALANIPLSGVVEGSAVVLNGKIYVYRSFQPPFEEPEAALKIYDPGSNSWTLGASLPLGNIYGTSLVVSGNRLFAIGGTNQFLDGFGAVNEYDPVNNIWIPRTPMPRARGWSAVHAIRGLIYVIGGIGYSPDPGTNFVDIYNPSTDSWSIGNPAPYRFWAAASTVISAQTSPSFTSYRIIIMGGTDDNFSPIPFVFEYDPDTSNWRQLNSLPNPLSRSVGAAVNNNLYFIGGRNGTNVVNTTFQGTPLQWAPALTITASSNTITTNSNGSLFVRLGNPPNSITTVTISSSDTAILPVPAAVTFNPGETLKTVPIQSSEANTGTVLVTAQLPVSMGGGVSTTNINIVARIPSIVTNQAGELTNTSALLSGSVNPNSANTNAWFEWSTDFNFNSYNSSAFQNVGSGNVSVPVMYRLENLLPNTTYYFRIVAANNGGITPRQIYYSFSTTSNVARPTLFDFDGDGKTDISVFRPSNGVWYISQSTNGFRAESFGMTGDKIVPGDYDGDRKTDIAVWRPSNGYWYIINSSNGTFRSTYFGQAGDIPIAGDFEGDGKADTAVYRPSNNNFYIMYSSDNSFHYQQWGANGDLPMMGDYDGDNKTDFAIFRPSSSIFYILRSSNGTVLGQQFGQSGDKPIAADFDGDGKTEIAVYRPSTGGWYYLQSSDNIFKGVSWGTSGDIPSAGDYDGDGKWDVAVFRPSNGTFYILQSTNSSLRAEQFGTSGDIPVPSAYLP